MYIANLAISFSHYIVIFAQNYYFYFIYANKFTIFCDFYMIFNNFWFIFIQNSHYFAIFSLHPPKGGEQQFTEAVGFHFVQFLSFEWTKSLLFVHRFIILDVSAFHSLYVKHSFITPYTSYTIQLT